MLAEHGLQRHALVLLLARLRAGARAARRGRPCPVHRLPRRTRRGRPRARSPRSSSATCPARTGIRRGGRDATSTATSGSSRSRRGSRARSRGGSAAHPAVVGWLVSNEMPLYGGPAAERRDRRVGTHRWSRRCGRRARRSRSRSATAPGASRSTGRDNGYSLRALAPLVDFVGPHVYPMQDDEVRQLLDRGVRVRAGRRLRQAGGARGVRRQLGLRLRRRTPPTTTARCCTRRCSPAPAAGSPGTTATTTTSATRTRTATTSSRCTSGSPTATGGRSRSCTRWPSSRRSCASCRGRGGSRVAGDAAIVVPEHFERVLPFTHARVPAGHPAPTSSSRTSPRARPTSRSALVRERDGLPDTARLYLAPCAKLLTAPGLDRLRELAPPARRSTSPTSPAARRASAGPWLDLAGRDLRRPPPAALRPGRPDRGRRGRLRASSRRSATSRPGRGSRSASQASRAPARTSRSTRPGRRSSRSTGTAGPRCSGTRSAPAPRCSAPTRSSTWPPARRGSTPRTPGGSTRRSPRSPGSRGRSGSTTRASSSGRLRRPRDRDRPFRQLLRATPSQAEPVVADGDPWNSPETLDHRPVRRARLPAARSPRRSGQRRVASRRSPRAKGGMRSSDKGLCPTSAPRRAGARVRRAARIRRGRTGHDRNPTRREQGLGLGLVLALACRRGRIAGVPGEPAPHRSTAFALPRAQTLYMSGTQWSPNNDLNPAKNWDYVTGLGGFVYETPFRYDPLKDTFIPWLAIGRDVDVEDVYVMTVRQGVKWSDGKPLTAADVKYSFDTLKIATHPQHALWQDTGLKSIKAAGNTVVFTFGGSPGYQQFDFYRFNVAHRPAAHLQELQRRRRSRPATSRTRARSSAPGRTCTSPAPRPARRRSCGRSGDNWWATKALGLKVGAASTSSTSTTRRTRRRSRTCSRGTSTSSTTSRRSRRSRATSKTYFSGTPYHLGANTTWLFPNTDQEAAQRPAVPAARSRTRST